MPLIALCIWPLIAMWIVKKWGRVQGVIYAVLVGALTLPEAYEVNLPGLPPFDKETSIILGALLGLWLTRPKATDGKDASKDSVGDSTLYKMMMALAALYLVSSAITVFANTEPLRFATRRIQGLGMRDLITMTWQCLLFLVPFFIAQRHLSGPKQQVELLKAFVVAGLIYSFLVLFEARMSPQLHRWTYGYFQHGWNQHIRGGNFRAIVFQPHGIWVGIFLFHCVMSSFILARLKETDGNKKLLYLFIGFWLSITLFLSRNFGATGLALLFVPMLWFLVPRIQVWISVTVVAAFLVFPALRQSGIVDFERTAEFVGRLSVERQQSFMFRVDNEDLYLERSALKPLTGWGIWARWRARDAFTGDDITTADGIWIIVLGERGWIGYVAFFGLLAAPILMLPRAARRRDLPPETAGIALILAATMIYQIPNDTIGPMTIIMAGALAGFVWRKAADDAKPENEFDTVQRTNQYTRFPTKRVRGSRNVSLRR